MCVCSLCMAIFSGRSWPNLACGILTPQGQLWVVNLGIGCIMVLRQYPAVQQCCTYCWWYGFFQHHQAVVIADGFENEIVVYNDSHLTANSIKPAFTYNCIAVTIHNDMLLVQPLLWNISFTVSLTFSCHHLVRGMLMSLSCQFEGGMQCIVKTDVSYICHCDVCRRTMIQCTSSAWWQSVSCSKYLDRSFSCCRYMKVRFVTCKLLCMPFRELAALSIHWCGCCHHGLAIFCLALFSVAKQSWFFNSFLCIKMLFGLEKHVSNVSITCFCNLCLLQHIQHKMFTSVKVHHFVMCRLDYCNIVRAPQSLIKLSPTNCNEWLNAAAQVVSSVKKFDCYYKQSLHADFHWLDVPECVKYKLCSTYDGQDGTAPHCLAVHWSPISDSASQQHLRSAASHQRTVPPH